MSKRRPRQYQGVQCPKCGKKGLRIADHPHAFGYKDTDRACCRFCHTVYLRAKLDPWLAKQEKEASP